MILNGTGDPAVIGDPGDRGKTQAGHAVDDIQNVADLEDPRDGSNVAGNVCHEGLSLGTELRWNHAGLVQLDSLMIFQE